MRQTVIKVSLLDLSYHQELIVTDSIRPTLKRWILVILLSVLLHLIILFGVRFEFSTGQRNPGMATTSIEVVLLKTPLQTKPIIKRIKAATQMPVPTNKRYLKNANTTSSSKKDTAILPRKIQEKNVNKLTAGGLPGQNKGIGNIVDKNEAGQRPKPDWNNIAKEVIRENFDKETVRNQRQGELWLKSPSVIYGKQRDFFYKQDKRAMLADTDESKRKGIFPKKVKHSGIGLNFGKKCFLGFKAVDEHDLESGDSNIGSSIPFSCNF